MTPRYLKWLRKRRGWTTKVLAAKLGVHHVTVRRWEAGTYKITKDKERAIREALIEGEGKP
jgi:transcriptional regulator with XRE-family HTH domain